MVFLCVIDRISFQERRKYASDLHTVYNRDRDTSISNQCSEIPENHLVDRFRFQSPRKLNINVKRLCSVSAGQRILHCGYF